MLFTKNGLSIAFGLVQHAGFIVNRVFNFGGVRAGAGVFGHPPIGHKELGDFFVDGKGFGISLGALGGRQAPVVHGADHAAAVDVFEGQAVLLNQRAAYGADTGAVRVFDSAGMFGMLWGP